MVTFMSSVVDKYPKLPGGTSQATQHFIWNSTMHALQAGCHYLATFD